MITHDAGMLEKRSAFTSRQLPRLLATILALSLGAAALTACSGTSAKPDATSVPTSPRDFGPQWGVEIVALRSSAAGYMLDFRYRVKDVEKAAPLLKQGAKAYVIVEKNGAQLFIPVVSRIGPLRQSATKIYADRNYFVLFANPGKLVQPGDAVTVVIGDFKAEHLIVDQS